MINECEECGNLYDKDVPKLTIAAMMKKMTDELFERNMNQMKWTLAHDIKVAAWKGQDTLKWNPYFHDMSYGTRDSGLHVDKDDFSDLPEDMKLRYHVEICKFAEESGYTIISDPACRALSFSFIVSWGGGS